MVFPELVQSTYFLFQIIAAMLEDGSGDLVISHDMHSLVGVGKTFLDECGILRLELV